jgi:dihydroorotate dehydrogenase electron transfer subunit
MTTFQEQAEIVRRQQLAPDLYRFTVQAPDIAGAARPGQFVMIRAGQGYDPLLRRPFSIHQVAAGVELQVLFKVVGKGTRLLAAMDVGQSLDLVGPLGKGFVLRTRQPVCLVGGGVGIAPLLFWAKELLQAMAAPEIIVLLGARTGAELEAMAEDFTDLGLEVRIATDDGSWGYHGLVTDLMGELAAHKSLAVYTCGPYPMMRTAVKQCTVHGWDCQVSLETMMACGVAACLGCAISKAAGPGYLHVCKDGPVMAADEVLWL